MNEVNGTAVDMELEPEGGLMPEQDEVSRPAVVDTKDEWTCGNCTTTNSVADNPVCRECGSPYVSEKLADLGVTQNGVMAVAGALVEHAANAAGAEQVENPNRKPTDVPLPLDTEGDEVEGFERFNANKAMSTIIAKNTEVQVARDKYEDLKKRTADAKKELDQDEAALGRIITSFSKAREVQNSPQAMLPLNGQPAAIDSACPWERNHPGQKCVVCEGAKAKKLNPDAASAVHPDHDAHEDTAEEAFQFNVITPLIPKLRAKGFAITADELNELDADQLQSLIDWTEQNGIVPPAILATAHVAAAPGELAQLCKHCDIDLAFSTDPEGFYAEDELVGLDCDAKLNEIVDRIETEVTEETAAAEAPVEPARKPKSHAKKDGKKKRQPEQDRVEQVAAGRERVNGKPVPKKAEPKKAKAKKAAKRGGK